MKKKNLTNEHIVFFSALLFIFFTFSTIAQVGINTITPAEGALLDVTSTDKGVMIPKVSIADLSTIDPVTGVTATVPGLAAVEGLLVYNTNGTTGPGYFYWTGTQWAEVGQSIEPPIDSVSLVGDIQISSATWAAVPGITTLTFTARKTSAMVNLSASGFAFTNSMAYVELRILNGGTSIGGTSTNMQSYDDVTGTTTSWSCSYSKVLTGLTIGTDYTLTVQGQVDGILGTFNAAIFENSFPDGHHMTLSVMQ